MWTRLSTPPRFFAIPLLVIFLLLLLYNRTSSSAPLPHSQPHFTADQSGKYTLRSSHLRAQFVPYGASISNLFLTDKHGIERDIVLGFDTAHEYTTAKRNDHLGGIVGRYANRIKNSTFELDGTKYHVPSNEGQNMLHGGSKGWNSREWEVLDRTESEIVFGLTDPDGEMGFPGEVRATVKYTLDPNLPVWDIDIRARVYKHETPLMLTSHVYWNLDGWGNEQDQSVLVHVLELPNSRERVVVDGELIPTGEIAKIEENGRFDFYSMKQHKLRQTAPEDGKREGLDDCFLVTQAGDVEYIAHLSSEWSGISVKIISEQAGFQVYTCQGEDGTRSLKRSQGSGKVQQYGCIVMEAQDWIDAINHPEWKRTPVWAPEDGEYVVKIRHLISTKE